MDLSVKWPGRSVMHESRTLHLLQPDQLRPLVNSRIDGFTVASLLLLDGSTLLRDSLVTTSRGELVSAIPITYAGPRHTSTLSSIDASLVF
jgi:hypothetical protein